MTLEDVVLYEPYIDDTAESQAIKDYLAVLRKEIIWSRFTDYDNERDLYIDSDSVFMGELDHLWYNVMTPMDRELANDLTSVWCHANLAWYDDYTDREFYENHKARNAKIFASEHPPKRVDVSEYLAIRKAITGK